MRMRTVLAVALLAAAAHTTQAQTLEVAYPQADWLTIGAPINSPDPEYITRHPLTGNLVLTNGGDTSDSDGDAIVEFTPGGPGTFVKAYCSGDQIEAAVLAFTGAAFTNNDFIGLGVNLNGDVIVPIDDSGSTASDAWLLRVNAGSTFASPSISFLSGSTANDGPIDGTLDVAMAGNTVFLLQVAGAGIAETRIVTFDTTAAPQVDAATPVPETLFLTQAELLAGLEVILGDATAAAAELGQINGIAVMPPLAGNPPRLILMAGFPDLILAIPASRNIYSIPLDKSTPLALVKSGAAFETEAIASKLGYPGFLGYADGALTINPANGDLYITTFHTEVPGYFDSCDYLRLDMQTVTGSVIKTRAEIEADPAYINEGGPGPLLENQVDGIAVTGNHLYFTLETDTSNTDFFGRLSLPGATPLLGDVNLDTFVDVRDVTLLGNAIAMIEMLPPGANGDINNDTFVNSADVAALVAIIVP